ncbi:hypothetical protein GCM10023196_023110 [Actinoallomurus vinaceus]|uniref:SH3 domain-containing protein n=1 Tax=Actinoallomurus vinaceus TaxID=1080074 RepID=A0ABP8U5J9_9ACTN
MKKILVTSAALTLLAVAGLVSPGPASAAQAGSAASCELLRAKENLKIRKSPTDGTALGLMLQGATACSQDFKAGTTYTACGATDNHYTKLTSRGITGWVVDTCLVIA